MIHVARVLLAAASFAVILAHPTAAEIYRPWCAQYMGSRGGSTNCGFISYEQCMMTARGAGAFCIQNPWYLEYGSGQKGADQYRRSGRR